MPIIETKSLTKLYGKARGIENVTLRIESGEFLGFIGPNGAGKSTTIKTLPRLVSASSGTAQVPGCAPALAALVLGMLHYARKDIAA